MKKLSIILFTLVFLYAGRAVNAGNFKVAVMEIPGADSYKMFFNALGEATNNSFEVEIVPPARAIYMIENSMTDIQFPEIKCKNDAFNRALKYDYANAKTGDVIAFVLYTNKNNQVDINDLRNGNTKSYKIEADGSNGKRFGFTTIFSRSPEESLRRVSTGKIDGYVMSQPVGDGALKTLDLKNIRRQLWENYESTFTLQKGQAGGKLDNILAEGIKRLKANGKFDKILAVVLNESKYSNWQP